MRTHDVKLLEEAYQTILEKKKQCKYAKDGCDCDECKECKSNQKKELSPKQKKIAQAAPPPNKITGADFAAMKNKSKKKPVIKEGVLFDEVCRLLNC